MRTLVVVDEQKHFYDPSGALYVKGGEKTVPNIKDLILTDRSINQIIFTADWHTPEDRSFKKNGGKWEVHCVQFSEGASISGELLEAAMYRGFKSIDGSYYEGGEPEVNKFFISNTYDVFQKGDIPGEEEYVAFCEYEESEEDEDLVIMTGASGDSCAYLNTQNDVIVCGLAGDYCVLETAKNLLEILRGREGAGKLMMYLSGIASIDGGKKLVEWMKKEGIKEYNYGL